MPKLKVTRSRRVQGLKPDDYDHEIETLDHDPLQPSPNTTANFSRVSTTSRLLQDGGQSPGGSQVPDSERDGSFRIQERPQEEFQYEQDLPHEALRPSIEIQAPTPHNLDGDIQVKPKPRVERETAVDILYENERGGFLCGVGLFSGQALGGLDPTPWTNAYHKPSPTSIHTAQVPDPSWEWAWSEWHVNHQDGMDDCGWEYSFSFSKKFSWHGPKWWNSFVRRRAWTRKRIKKRPEDISADPHMLSTDYFTVRPASDRIRRSMASLASSRATSKASMSQVSSIDVVSEKPDIDDIETLLQTMRQARIDREKLEAMENYLENAIDLAQLQEEMHNIMSLFMFQASRRKLLGRLMDIYNETVDELEKNDTADLRNRKEALAPAIKHADEEVRRLAYWSDVKQMAENGESRGAVDGGLGWNGEWQGVDQSAPTEPNKGKLPEP